MLPSCEKCNYIHANATHFHAWHVDWKNVIPKLSEESRSLLQYKYLCENCKKPLKKELMRVMNFSDLKLGEKEEIT